MGLRVRIRPDKIREPDNVFIAKENYSRRGDRYWSGADLVIEIVSPDEASRNRDHRRKVVDYAEARIPEFWIVDPEKKEITVLSLAENAKQYSSCGVFRPGEGAASRQLEGFSVDVQSVFDAANV
jgi:Uma2 family endonuclease